MLPQVIGDDLLRATDFVLDETLSVWTLASDDLSETSSILELAIRLPRWHHQVVIDGVASAFARSAVSDLGPDDISVVEIYSSEIATKIASGLAWAEENSHALVRLLILPGYMVHALWLHDNADEAVLIVDRPDSFENLALMHAYPEREFFELLRRLPNIEGVTRE